MSDVKAVRYLLANNGALTAVVPAARIVAGPLPEGSAVPAVSITHISAIRRHILHAQSAEYCTARVQVTAITATYPGLKSTLALVRAALPNTHATVSGVDVDSILSDAEGPDFYDSELKLHSGSLDFIVTFNE